MGSRLNFISSVIWAAVRLDERRKEEWMVTTGAFGSIGGCVAPEPVAFPEGAEVPGLAVDGTGVPGLTVEFPGVPGLIVVGGTVVSTAASIAVLV